MRCSWCKDQPETPPCAMCVVPLGNAVCRTWREIASVGALVEARAWKETAAANAGRLHKKLQAAREHATTLCACDVDYACHEHRMLDVIEHAR